jgi:hypothetical protein
MLTANVCQGLVQETTFEEDDEDEEMAGMEIAEHQQQEDGNHPLLFTKLSIVFPIISLG